jgi:hypothetical protein
MSDAEQSSDNGGFSFDDIMESINEKLESFKGQVETSNDREDFEQGHYDGPIILASDDDVIFEAKTKIRDVRQQQKAIDVGIEDEEKIKKIEVELDVPDNTSVLLKEFDNILAEVRQPIVDELERREQGADKNPMVSDDEPIMTYIFERDAGAYGDVTIFGGAKALIFNLCDEYGYTEDERELIRKCHEVAAEKNGVERHTLIEDVVIAPQFKHEDVDIVE